VTPWSRPSTGPGAKAGIKGFDAAVAAIEMVNLVRQLPES
jgi:hypothetical protein